jgi:HAD superfamily hydrolase (TIGR01509 family)
MRFADLDAVTVDGFGTLLELEDPVARLAAELEARGVDRSEDEVTEAFAEEACYYRRHAERGHDEKSLFQLRVNCMAVFLHVLAAPLDPQDFVEPFLAALVFSSADGAVEALASLREHHLKLAVVSNWDYSLPERLSELGLLDSFDTVVTSAEAGAAKPAPRPFWLALERLDVAPERALHVGDERADEEGATAAGMRFAPAPLSSAVETLS